MQAAINSFDALGNHLWTLSWQVLVLAAAAGIVELIARRSSPLFRYWLWIIVLARLCVPVAIPALPGLDGFLRGIFPDRPPIVEEIALPDFPLTMPDLPPMTDLPEYAAPVEPVKPAWPSIPLTALFGMVWLAATLGLGAAILWRIRRIRRVLRTCRAVDDPGLRALTDAIAARLGIRRPVRLLACDRPGFEGPAAVGALRPAILLPTALMNDAEAIALEPVLAHELSHIRRGDLFLNWLQAAVQVAFWFHPAVWLANHRLRALREEACDDLAVHAIGGERRRYGAGVLRAVELGRASALGFVGLFLIERKRGLSRRIARLAAMNYRGAVRLSLPAVLALVLVGTAGVVVSGVGAENPTQDSGGISMRDAMKPIGHAGPPSGMISDDIVIRDESMDTEKKKAIGKFFIGEQITVGFTIARAQLQQLGPPDSTVKHAVFNLAEAVNRYTNIDATPEGSLLLDRDTLFEIPVVFILADSAFTLTDAERGNLAAYLRNGGFAVLDNGTPQFEYGIVEASLRQALRDALGTDAKFLPIENTHPIYHCFFDFDDGPPQGTEMSGKPTPNRSNETARSEQYVTKAAPYLEGIWLYGRLVAIYSDKGYAHKWNELSDNIPQLKLAVNMVVFALLQEGGMMARIDEQENTPGIDSPSGDIRPGETGYVTGRPLSHDDSLFIEAYRLLETPDWEKGINLIRELKPSFSAFLPARLVAGQRLMQAHRFEDVIDLMTDTLAKSVADTSLVRVTQAHVIRGNSYYYMGHLEEAAADFTAALETAPPEFHDNIVFTRAMVYLDMRREDEAKRELIPLLDSPDAEARRNAIRYLDRMTGGGNLPLPEGETDSPARTLLFAGDQLYNKDENGAAYEVYRTVIDRYPGTKYASYAVQALPRVEARDKRQDISAIYILMKDAQDRGNTALFIELSKIANKMEEDSRNIENRTNTPSQDGARVLAPSGVDPRLQIRILSADSVIFEYKKIAIDSLAAALAAADKDRLAEGILIIVYYPRRRDTLDRIIAIARGQVGNDIAIGVQENPTMSRADLKELFERSRPDTSAAARGTTAITRDPRMFIKGFQQEFEPAGVPLTDAQRERILKVFIPYDNRAMMGVLTREQKQVIVKGFREKLAGSPHPLSEEQEARIMAFGPDGKDTTWRDIITQEQLQYISTSAGENGTNGGQGARTLAPPGNDTRLQVRIISADSVLFLDERMPMDVFEDSLQTIEKSGRPVDLAIDIEPSTSPDALYRVSKLAWKYDSDDNIGYLMGRDESGSLEASRKVRDAIGARIWFETGEQKLIEGNHDEALAAFQTIVDNYPDSDYAAQARNRITEIKKKMQSPANESGARLLAPPGTDTRLQIRIISADSVLFDGRRLAIDSLADALAAADKDRLAEGLLIVLDGGGRLDTLQRIIAIARGQVGNEIAIGVQKNPPLSREEAAEAFQRAMERRDSTAARSQPESSAPDVDYYPLAVGRSWTYRETVLDSTRRVSQRTISVQSTSKSDPETIYTLRQEGGDEGTTYIYLAKYANGMITALMLSTWPNLLLADFGLPMVLWKRDLAAGDTWQRPDGREIRQVIALKASVTVPAGTFHDCAHIKTIMLVPAEKLRNESDIWFAPNVGMVKSISQSADNTYERNRVGELLSYQSE